MKTYLSIFLFLFLLASCSSNDDQEQEIINQPQCLTPTSISINNITENSAVINWSNTEGSSSYEIEFGVSGFTQGSGTQLMSNLNTIIIDNLTPETDYDIYIKSLCNNESSSWSNLYSFSTTALVLEVPVVYLMTSLDSSTKLLKWHPINQVTSYTIVYDQSGFDINNNNANTLQTNDTEIEIQYSSWISYDVYVKANYPNNTSSEWNGPFNSSNNGSSCGAFNLNAYPSQQPNRLYINWGETWQTGFNVNSWTLEYGPTGFNSGNGTIVNASNTSSPPYFIENLEFETEYDIYIKGNCSNNGQSIYTGFITVSTLEACAAPYSFEINQIENNSITVYCDASFNEDVELIYGEAGFNIADGISQTYSNSYIEITGLLPNTTYEFYARTTCTNGEVSNLIGPISATTLN